MGMTINKLMRMATHGYLSVLDLVNLPAPDVIEENVLEETKLMIVSENSTRQPGDKLKIPQRLDTWQLASILSYI